MQKPSCLILCLAILTGCATTQNKSANKVSSEEYCSHQDSLGITDEELEKAMQFGIKEKTSSIIMGGFLGIWIFGGTGALISGSDQYAKLAGAFYGGIVGLVVGPIFNYSIIRKLAKEDARKRLLQEKKKNEE